MRVELVVVGSSLGGVKALQAILSQLPSTFLVPVVIAQHRHKDERGMERTLVNVLQQSCALPISEPYDNQRIEPGHVYLAPSDYHLLVESGTFSLSADGPVNHARPSIDLLFESAAEAFHDRVLGLILSGSGCDGQAGAAVLRRLGGELVVQDPATAECDLLPQLVLKSVTPDHLLELSEIGPFLVNSLNHSAATRNENNCSPSKNTPGRSS